MIIGIIAIALILVAICVATEFDNNHFPLSGIIGFLSFFIIVYNRPQAIDVYKGKTTFEITYRDSIPVDSTPFIDSIKKDYKERGTEIPKYGKLQTFSLEN